MKTNSPTMPKMLHVAGFIFEDLVLVFCTVERRHARGDGRAHVTEVRLDEKTCLSIYSQVVIHRAVMLQKFTDFKSLDIVPSITGHRCHGPIWALPNTFNVRSQSQSSQNIFQEHLWHPQFFHRTVSSSARHGRISIHVCACARETSAHVCAHAVINTPLSTSDKSMKNEME